MTEIEDKREGKIQINIMEKESGEEEKEEWQRKTRNYINSMGWWGFFSLLPSLLARLSKGTACCCTSCCYDVSSSM